MEYPRWVDRIVDWNMRLQDDEEKMRFVMELTTQVAIHHTGGPFAAAIFQRGEGRLVSVGMNLVPTTNNPILHGPIVAIMMATAREGSPSLAGDGHAEYEIVASCEPCGMCGNAILMCGLGRVVFSASSHDAAQIGMERGDFDLATLRQAGADVVSKVLAAEGRRALRNYAQGCGPTYNPPRRTG